MSTTKNTPGPWAVLGEDYAQGSHLTVHGKGSQVASIAKTTRNSTANAKLIAAAPDLLDALTDMCETMEHQNYGIKSPDQWQTEAYRNARAAIAKATAQ